MNYGYFDDGNREYIITNPKTPTKWINYVGGLSFGGFVDHTGGSLICKGDPAINRITKYIPQMPDSEFKGETLYVRLKTKDGYKVFSPFYVPTLDEYEKYECHVGLGYTKIISEFYSIRCEVTIFVPFESKRVIRDIKVTNLSKESKEIDLIPVVEYTHFEALKQFNNNDWVPQTMQSECVYEDDGHKVVFQYAFMKKDTAMNYYTSNYSISSFETDRKIFLGNDGYGTWQDPKSLEKEEFSNYEARRGDNVCALMHHLGSVKPNETKRIILQLGQCASYEAEKSEIAKYRDEKAIDEQLQKLGEYWDEYLSHLNVQTPNKEFNTMVNIHNPRQCYMTKNWSRYLSLYQLGLGARGIGFRDSSQDVLGVLASMKDEARELIEKLLKVQMRDGSSMHQFNPVSMIANRGDSQEMEDRPDYYGDDHLWIIYSVCEYIKETGDFEFLEKEIEFYDKDKQEKPIESGTVMDHIERAVNFTRNNLGQHGLPLLGFADWNDPTNLPTGAESIFIANQYGVALNQLCDLFEYLGDMQKVQKYRGYYEDMKETVNKTCWDGEWFVRYFNFDGEPIGSDKNAEGKIYTNAQSWSVMSGFAEETRAKKALDSVNKYLNTENGIKLSYPGYDKFDPKKGGISTYPPGAKENGGIFLHSNPWVMIAETMVGNGKRAVEYYNQINPVTKNEKIDEYELEPYVYAQNILGNEHPQFGLARNSWLSGTASWTYQAATKYILGIKPTFGGLMINPCIDPQWDGFKAIRKYRGTTYNIEVVNESKASKGVKKMIVDGEEAEGNIIPISQSKECNVMVIM
ncbi:MAG: glycosyl transferase [Eubacteriales bacterium]